MLNERRQQKEQEWSPYVGPRPFKRDPEEQKLFFGRDDETEEIVSLVFGHKLVLIYAESGAGKTSIFNANIVPALEQKELQVLPLTRVGIRSRVSAESINSDTTFVGRSSYEINPYFLSAFQRLAPDIDQHSLLKTKSFSGFLHDYSPHQVNERGERIPQVVVFDQLEELFSFYSDPNKWREQQQDFFEQIADALQSDTLLRVVFIIREDYLAQLDPFASVLPEKLRPRFRLERLGRDAAFEAVKGPLERAKAHVDGKLIDKLFEKA